jgi:predicted ATPase/sugar phosphate isomerase/epimerase
MRGSPDEREPPAASGRTPRPISRFIGREPDLAALGALLGRGERLVTLVGGAGVGKSRIALELARRSASLWQETPCRVELAGTHRLDTVCERVGRELALPAGHLPASIGPALAARGAALLVLDDVDEPAIGRLVLDWLEAAPELRVVCTARERLRVGGEIVHEVGPLAEAEELFLDRARSARAGYQPTPGDEAAIAAIVARLDRIPLAVELAAARMRALAPAEILGHLEDGLDFLSRGSREAPSRQATMRAAIDWSWRALAPDEQCVLRRAAVFAGGFTVAAAEAILGDGVAAPVVDVVESLRDKSLLYDCAGPSELARRFGMYESVRAFAREELEAAGETEALVERHARHFLDWAEARLGIEPDEPTLRALLQERSNIEILLGPPAAGAGAEVALRAGAVLAALAPDEGVSLSELAAIETALGNAAERGADPRHLARARVARGAKLVFLARFDEAERELEAALAVAEQHRDAALEAAAHYALGQTHYASGALARAERHWRRALEMVRALGDHAAEARTLQHLGATAESLGRTAEALACFERSLSACRLHGLPRVELRVRAGLGFFHLEAEAHDESERHYRRCLELARALGTRRTACLATGYLGLLRFDQRRLDEALEHLEAAVAEARELGDPRAQGVFSAVAGAVRASRGEIEEAVVLFGAAGLLLEGSAFWRAVCDIHRGHLDLARARQAAARGDGAAAQTLREAAAERAAAARRPIAGEAAIALRSDDARVGLRILERALAMPEAARAGDAARGVTLLVPHDAGWFELAGGARVTLGRRGVLRRLLAVLCQARRETPSVALSGGELIAAGWPEERMTRSAALNRLHVALTTLRSLGLRQILERRGDGYCLAASVTVERPSGAGRR